MDKFFELTLLSEGNLWTGLGVL